MIRHLFYNIFTELNAIFRDPGVLIVMVGAVVFYSFIYPLPYSREVLKQVPLTIVDHDNSPLSRQLARMTDASELIRVVSREPDMEQARRKIESRKSSGILVIPDGFEKEVLQGRKTHVSAYVDATYFLVYRQAMTGIVMTARTLSAGIEVSRFKARGWSHEKAMIDRSPLNLESRSLFNPYMGYATYIVPAVMLLLLQQTMLIGIGMVSGTRREQLQEKKAVILLQGGPLVRILGQTIACMALYLIHIYFFYAVVYQIWDFPLRVRVLDMFVFLIPFLLSVVLMGQFLATFFKTRESAIIMIVWSSMVAVLISGFSWPVEAMPHWIRAISMLLPSTWGISGGLRMAQMGASFEHVMDEWLCMWGLGFFYLFLAWICIRFMAKVPEKKLQSSRDDTITGY
ncbi:MAG: ABC transporter permease [Desulfobacteraceae bacterium]|nr:ABC transporter permease [Desulfobacteraceae bacterium]